MRNYKIYRSKLIFGCMMVIAIVGCSNINTIAMGESTIPFTQSKQERAAHIEASSIVVKTEKKIDVVHISNKPKRKSTVTLSRGGDLNDLEFKNNKIVSSAVVTTETGIAPGAVTIATDNVIVKHEKSYNITKNVDVFNTVKERWVTVEVSHYTSDEATDEPGCETLRAIGGKLRDGDIAMPRSFPKGTQVVLKDQDGNIVKDDDGEQIILTNVDSGSIKCVKKFSSDDKQRFSRGSYTDTKNKIGVPEMRIDRYMAGMDSHDARKLGLKYYKMYVVRWGWDTKIDIN
jgi:hypothetical protein